MIGETFNYLTVVRELFRDKHSKMQYVCKCKCGEITFAVKAQLTGNKKKSCGCFKAERIKEVHKIDLTGQVFGSLTAIKEDGRTSEGLIAWLCRCECGNETRVKVASLRNGNTKSCGDKKHNIKNIEAKYNHITYKSEYFIWSNMKNRCGNSDAKDYKYYGGRGISVCDRWLESFDNFFEDMGEKPEGYSIERINVNGNYEPSNCKWIPKSEQMKNTTRSLKNR